VTKKTDTWMPLYVTDYLGDTMHLSTTQHGAYLLLLLACWKSDGVLPDDDAQLAAITRLSLADWKKNAAVLRRFFSLTEQGLEHGRVRKELDKAVALSNKRAAVGAAGAASKWGESSGKTSGKTAAALRSERLAEARRKGRHTQGEWGALVDVLGHRCVACGIDAADLNGGSLCKDHIVPIFQGGDDSIANLQPMCRQCNTSKGGDSTDHRKKWVPDWSERLAKRLANDRQTSTPSPSPSQVVGTQPFVAEEHDGLNTHSAGVCFEPPSAGEVCKAMRAAGLQDANPGNQKLLTLLAAGADKAEFVTAAEKAAGEGKGFAYALGIVANTRIQAAQLASQIHRGPMPAATPNKQEALEQRNRQIADEWAAQGA